MKKEIKKLKFYWHIHHDVLVEPLTEPIKNRIEFIKENKPKDEVELRLKLMKPVKGKLPKELVEAGQKWKEAGQKRDLQIIALHKKECPNCPWDSKRQTIFSK